MGAAALSILCVRLGSDHFIPAFDCDSPERPQIPPSRFTPMALARSMNLTDFEAIFCQHLERLVSFESGFSHNANKAASGSLLTFWFLHDGFLVVTYNSGKVVTASGECQTEGKQLEIQRA